MRIGLIYKITNRVNAKSYIGQTIKSLDGRIQQHIRNTQKKGYPLCRAFRKYGIENFSWEVLYKDIPLDLLDIAEICTIYTYDTFGTNGYNCSEGGEGSRGRILSKETKLKISKTSEGRPKSKETREKLSKSNKGEKHWNYGKKHSEETKRKIGETSKGRFFSAEARKKISDAHKGEKNFYYGKHRSEETKEKIISAKGSKPFQVFKNGQFVGEWRSQAQCAKDLHLRQPLINTILHKKHQKTTGGYSFEFIGYEHQSCQASLPRDGKS